MYDTVTEKWSEKKIAKMTSKRYEHTAALLGDHHMIVVGGQDEDDKLMDTVEILDQKTCKWRTGASTPLPRSSHSSAVIDDRYLVVVGSRGQGDDNDGFTHVYDVSKDVWYTDLPALPMERSAAQMIRLGDQLLLVWEDTMVEWY
jgi:outer membrane protein assembly factor BamB